MRILLVNFPEIYSQGLVQLLLEIDPSAHIESLNSVTEAKTKLNFHRFDLVLFDYGNKFADDSNSLRTIVAKASPSPIVVIAERETPELLRNLKLHGVRGFVARSETVEALKRVINAVLSRCVSARKERQVRSGTRLPDEVQQYREELLKRKAVILTPRQLQVLRSLAQGKPNKVIARDLDVSENTVKAHLKAVFRILGARNRTEAVTHATRLRLIAH